MFVLGAFWGRRVGNPLRFDTLGTTSSVPQHIAGGGENANATFASGKRMVNARMASGRAKRTDWEQIRVPMYRFWRKTSDAEIIAGS